MREVCLQQTSSIRVWGSVGVAAIVVGLLWAGPTRAATAVSSCGTVISSPGDYQLSADLSCAGDGITIAASGVHLSMAGHGLTGDGTGTGISIVGVSGTWTCATAP